MSPRPRRGGHVSCSHRTPTTRPSDARPPSCDGSTPGPRCTSWWSPTVARGRRTDLPRRTSSSATPSSRAACTVLGLGEDAADPSVVPRAGAPVGGPRPGRRRLRRHPDASTHRGAHHLRGGPEPDHAALERPAAGRWPAPVRACWRIRSGSGTDPGRGNGPWRRRRVPSASGSATTSNASVGPWPSTAHNWPSSAGGDLVGGYGIGAAVSPPLPRRSGDVLPRPGRRAHGAATGPHDVKSPLRSRSVGVAAERVRIFIKRHRLLEHPAGWLSRTAASSPESLPVRLVLGPLRARLRGSMNAEEVLRILDALEDKGVRYWLSGGWGVDALAGRQTRPHDDLDIAIDDFERDEPRAAPGADRPRVRARRVPRAQDMDAAPVGARRRCRASCGLRQHRLGPSDRALRLPPAGVAPDRETRRSSARSSLRGPSGPSASRACRRTCSCCTTAGSPSSRPPAQRRAAARRARRVAAQHKRRSDGPSDRVTCDARRRTTRRDDRHP